MNALLLLALALQDGQAHPKVDQAKVDAAIDAGMAFLAAQAEFIKSREIYLTWEHSNKGSFRQKFVELTVLTLLHGGYDRESPAFKDLLDAMLREPLETTYRAALRAMVLHKLDPRNYQRQIAHCAQVLVDSQAQNGQWCYGHAADPTGIAEPVQTRSTGKGTEAPLPRIAVSKRAKGCPHGDNSNSQYAALGLRACIESGIVIPPEVLRKAREAWERGQKQDGSWDYGVPSNVKQANRPAGSYGSMTLGGMAALVILKHYLKEPAKGDPRIEGAKGWIARNFSPSDNPGFSGSHVFYALYALERAGDLYGTETFGSHEWYPAGAEWLLRAQQPDGQWTGSKNEANVAATCFAILFLRRATAPLPKIATGRGK
jgi:hypothetical protein